MNAARTHSKLCDLTSPALLKPSYLENGRRKWEAKAAGELIKMFAADGYDVVVDREPAGSRNHNRLVKSQDGNIAAFILWCDDVPNFAYAFTASA